MCDRVRRKLGFALLALYTLWNPAPVDAQERRADPSPPRLTVAPVLGVRGPLVAARGLQVFSADALIPVAAEWGSEADVGVVAGMEADLRLVGRVGLSVLGLFAGSEGIRVLTRVSDDLASESVIDGPATWLGALGLSLRLPEVVDGGPAGWVVAGPAWIRQDFGGTALDVPGTADRVTSPGIWLGYRAHAPVGIPGVRLHLALGDVVPFWETRDEGARLAQLLNLTGPAATSGIRGPDHLPLLRAGLAVVW